MKCLVCLSELSSRVLFTSTEEYCKECETRATYDEGVIESFSFAREYNATFVPKTKFPTAKHMKVPVAQPITFDPNPTPPDQAPTVTTKCFCGDPSCAGYSSLSNYPYWANWMDTI